MNTIVDRIGQHSKADGVVGIKVKSNLLSQIIIVSRSPNSLPTCGGRAQSASSKKIKADYHRPGKLKKKAIFQASFCHEKCIGHRRQPKEPTLHRIFESKYTLSSQLLLLLSFFKYYQKPLAIIENNKNKFPTVLGHHQLNITARRRKIHADFTMCMCVCIERKKEEEEQEINRRHSDETIRETSICASHTAHTHTRPKCFAVTVYASDYKLASTIHLFDTIQDNRKQ